jgi:hypothetical protein
MHAQTSPQLDAATVRRMLQQELSMKVRVGFTLLLLIGLAAASMIGSLWLTEPEPIPARTQIAFGTIIAINLSWAALAAWVLTQRKVLFAQHRVIAGWMAVAFCAAFLLIGSVVAMQQSNGAALSAVGIIGTAQLAVAVALLERARCQRRRLLARRAELFQELSSQ